MAMFYKGKKKLLEGNINLLTDNIKLALLTNAYILDLDHEFFSSMNTHQIVDAGYTVGGTLLSGKAVNQVVKKMYFDCNDIAWTIVGSVSVKYGVAYKDTGVLGTSPVLAVFVFEPDRVIVASTKTFKVNTLGLIELQ